MWHTLESDPGLFTELVEKWGIKNIEFNEVFGADPESFDSLECDKIYGVIFLFNHTARPQDASEPNYNASAPVYFANQVVENSCATQALLGLVLSQSEQLELSEELEQLQNFTAGLDPDMRGEIIGMSDFLRMKHNSMCSPPAFVDDGSSASRERAPDAYHYVAFVPKNGHIYELDGLRPAPIDHGTYVDGAMIDKLSEVVKNRIASYEESQLGFSIMLASNDLRHSPSHAKDMQWIAQQQYKRERWSRENKLRSFAFTGLAIELLKQMA